VTLLQLTIGYLGVVIGALTVAGLLLRERAGICRAFTVYLSCVTIADLLGLVAPDRFWTWEFWLFKRTVFDVLELSIAVELAYWIFLGFPGAARSARGLLFLFLAGTLVAVLVLPHETMAGDQSDVLLGFLRLRLEVGTAWIFTAIAALVRWYDIPLPSIHRSIILGFVIHLFVFSTLLETIAAHGYEWAAPLITLSPAVFGAICCWWAWTAWRPEPALEVAPELMAVLQPWRSR
jgi:hypothetical protein